MNIWIIALITVVLLFQIVALPGLILKKNDLADVLWGPAFPITVLVAAHMGLEKGLASLDARAALILAVVGVWSARLFVHVGWRNLSTLKEDVRYNNWRKQWGQTQVWRSYLQVFVLQPLILYVFLVPVLLALGASRPLGVLAYLGLFTWVAGFAIESIADEQLRRFKSDGANKGRLMTNGIWSWSRHPNYFGEVVQWWGIWLMVLELPYGWLTVISPLGVTYLLTKVSGVDMLEDLMKSRPGFAEYAARTSVFFPLPPRRDIPCHPYIDVFK